MSNTQNQWIPVSERLPDDVSKPYLVLMDEGKTPGIAYLRNDVWFPRDSCNRIPNVTHWMDLPEPPVPPKPADPFEAWLDKQRFRDTHLNKACFYTPELKVLGVNTAKWVWDAAKEHYAKPLPDFETWWKSGALISLYPEGPYVSYRIAKIIWNAAQGKPEA